MSVCSSLISVWSISPILFEVGIPNLICGYTLGSRSIAYYYWVIVTLASGHNSRKIESEAYLQYYLVGIPNLVCGYTLGSRGVTYCLWVTVTLNSGINSRNIMSLGAFVTLWHISCLFLFIDLTPDEKELLTTIRERKAQLLLEIQVSCTLCYSEVKIISMHHVIHVRSPNRVPTSSGNHGKPGKSL